MVIKRRRFKQQLTLRDRLAAWAAAIREQAAALPPGRDRDLLMTKASQAETASHLNERANSTGLQAPK